MKLNEQDTIQVFKSYLEPIQGLFLRTYGVLCGSEALFIYQLLQSLDELELPLKELVQSAHLNLSQVNTAIDRLYELQLIDLKVSQSQNRILRVTFKPILSAQELIKHDVLGRQLLKDIGADAFEKLRAKVNHQKLSNDGFSDYTLEARNFKSASWSMDEEKQFQQSHKPKHDLKSLNFDLISFLNECSPLIFPSSMRSEESLAAIVEIGAVYGINVTQMIHLVGKAYVKNDQSLNIDKLRKLAAKVNPVEEIEYEDPYLYPPAVFLKRLRKGIEASSLEKYLLVKLVSKDGLKPEVLNVLLESHFNQYHSKINTKVLEEVALQWAVQNIRTKDEAFEKVKAQTTKGRRVETKTDYGQKEHKLSDAELKALEEALKELK